MPTTNPVPSTDPTDLLFNAGKLDEVVNGTAASYTDRLGVSRRSLAGIDATADNVLNGIGYAVPVAYASGISLTLTSQTVDYNGVIYAPKSSALPFTTSSWGTDAAKFRAIQVTYADLITYNPTGTGAVATTVQRKLLETVSVKDFGAVGDGVADDTAAIQAAIDVCVGSKPLHIPFGTYKTSAPLLVKGSLILFGDGNKGGGSSIIKYTGSDAAFRFKKDGFVAGNSAYWIYAAVVSHLTVQNTGSGGIAFDLYGLSECQFDNVGVGGTPSSLFAEAFALTDCNIVAFVNPLVSFTSGCAFNFRSVPSNRFITNAVISIVGGDFYSNPQLFRCNGLTGLTVENGAWVEYSNTVFAFDDSLGHIECSSIKFIGNNVIMSLPSTVGFVYLSNTGTNLARVTDFVASHNRLNFTASLPGTVKPVNCAISATTDALTKVDMQFLANAIYTALAGIATANSTRVTYRFVHNINYDASTLLPSVPSLISGAVCNATETKTEAKSTMIGANADRTVGSTLLVHEQPGATTFAIKAGASQGTTSLQSWFDSSGNFLGGINFQGALVSNADYLSLKSKRLYSLNGVPAFGSWNPGELLWNPDGSSGQTVALWKCVATGTGNSSFRQIAHEVRKGTTAQRPSLNPTSDIGVLYLDTTLAAAGKPIWYNGTAWVDATGATV